MSAVLSVFNRNNEAVDPYIIKAMLAATSEKAVDGQDSWFETNVALAHQHFWITPEEVGERQPLQDAAGCRTIVADARLDNRPELLQLLGRDDAQGSIISDASLILLAYLRWGTACVERLLGEFAFAIWDADEQHLFAARDALGARGLCYYIDRDRCIVVSDVIQLLAHPAVPRQVNDGKIAEFLAEIWFDQEETFYENVFYCPPAHALLVTTHNVSKWRYWDFDPQIRVRYKDDNEYSAHFLELLTEAVRCRLRSTGPVGISLSGGLDSTTLAAVTANLLPQEGLSQHRLKSFSYMFDELTSCDERHYIRPVVDRYQLDATYIPSDGSWTLRNSENWPVYEDFVFSNPYAWLPLSAMKAAQQEGCRLLMGGYHGDVLFNGGRFWAAGMLSDRRYWQLAKATLKYRPFINPRRDLLNNGLRHMLPHRLRMAYRSSRARGTFEFRPGLHPDLVKRTRLPARLYVNSDRRAAFGPDQWHRYLGLTLGVFAQGRAVAKSQYDRHGLELISPYWDRRLLEFALALPADQLGRPHRNRWLHRNAASQLLPKLVSERRQPTSFEPLMIKGLQKEKASLARIMKDPLIVEQRYVEADWLRQQLQNGEGWSKPDQSYFFWKCLSLEMWLKKVFSKKSITHILGE